MTAGAGPLVVIAVSLAPTAVHDTEQSVGYVAPLHTALRNSDARDSLKATRRRNIANARHYRLYVCMLKTRPV